jgi:putative hydroxymethylpyrimidine transport system permease protein
LAGCLIFFWQIIVFIFALPAYILPGPWLVFLSIYKNFYLLLQQFIPTLIETLLGLLLGLGFGMLAALWMAQIKWGRKWLFSLLLASQAIPTFAIAPLLVLWFGYGMSAKIITTSIMVFFPVTSSFYDGLLHTPKIFLEQANIMNALPAKLLWQIRVPAALPHLASGIRLAAVYAPVGAIVGEWVGSSRGLGFLMLNANARMQTALVFACLIFILLLSLSLYGLVNFLLKKYINWI